MGDNLPAAGPNSLLSLGERLPAAPALNVAFLVVPGGNEQNSPAAAGPRQSARGGESVPPPWRWALPTSGTTAESEAVLALGVTTSTLRCASAACVPPSSAAFPSTTASLPPDVWQPGSWDT
ncbi:unnamed protein product, partial [Ixodes pacificus]